MGPVTHQSHIQICRKEKVIEAEQNLEVRMRGNVSPVHLPCHPQQPSPLTGSSSFHAVDRVITIDFVCCLRSTSNICCPQQVPCCGQVITINLACCLGSTSNVCCPQQASLVGFQAGQAHILQFSCHRRLLPTAGVMLWTVL